MLDAIYKLDPLPGIREDEKMARLSNGGVTEISYIISCNRIRRLERTIYKIVLSLRHEKIRDKFKGVNSILFYKRFADDIH
jgi:hypothetical protein